MQRIGHSPALSVVLTPTGARRIGVQTAPVVAVRVSTSMTVIPYAALLYEPGGSTTVYLNTAPLVYTRRFITVDHIVGNLVYVSQDLTPGMRVVTVGAEELLGVQNGVGVET
jgi:multidrug efflux pump subunit AcrA (membrane-fusion protein)